MSDTSSLTRRDLARFVVLPATALALGGCLAGSGGALTGEEPVAQAPAGDPNALGQGSVKVALILPLTGAGQGAVAGAALRNAADLAIAEFQNPDIQLLVKDDQGTAAGARAAAQAALGEGAELVIGPLFAQAVQGAAQVTRAANRPMIAFSTDASVATRGVYLLSFLAENEVERVVTYAVSQNRRGFAALVPETPYGRVTEAAFQQAVAARSGRLLGLERYPAGDRNAMTEAARRLAQTAAQADALFMPEGGEQIALLAGAAQTAGFNLQRTRPLGTGLWNDARAFRVPQLAGGWFAAPDGAGYDAFAQRYRARFNADPTRIATLAYDAVSLAAALVRTQGAQRFTEATLTSASGFAGVDGVFRFLSNGTNERALAVYEIRGGASAVVSGAPTSLARA